MRRSRNEDTSLSFLDVIACAFGAIVLLVLILPIGTFGIFAEAKPVQVDIGQLIQTRLGLDEAIAELEEQIEANSQTLQVIRNQASSNEERTQNYDDAINTTNQKIQETQQQIAAIERESEAIKSSSRRVSQFKQKEDYAGIPVDSEYVAFVIDTSSSMRNVWGAVLREVRGVLSLYPQIKGFQILNDQGRYMFEGSQGRWLKDTQVRRNQAQARLVSWRAASMSSPAKGIKTAIKDLYSPDKKMAVFIFGDDFSENTDLDQYIREIEVIAKSSAIHEDTLRIHAFGFANQGMVYSELRISVLMRELTLRHNGAFLALPFQERPFPPTGS